MGRRNSTSHGDPVIDLADFSSSISSPSKAQKARNVLSFRRRTTIPPGGAPSSGAAPNCDDQSTPTRRASLSRKLSQYRVKMTESHSASTGASPLLSSPIPVPPAQLPLTPPTAMSRRASLTRSARPGESRHGGGSSSTSPRPVAYVEGYRKDSVISRIPAHQPQRRKSIAVTNVGRSSPSPASAASPPRSRRASFQCPPAVNVRRHSLSDTDMVLPRRVSCHLHSGHGPTNTRIAATPDDRASSGPSTSRYRAWGQFRQPLFFDEPNTGPSQIKQIERTLDRMDMLLRDPESCDKAADRVMESYCGTLQQTDIPSYLIDYIIKDLSKVCGLPPPSREMMEDIVKTYCAESSIDRDTFQKSYRALLEEFRKFLTELCVKQDLSLPSKPNPPAVSR